MQEIAASRWFEEFLSMNPGIQLDQSGVARINEHTVLFKQRSSDGARLAVAYFLPPIPGSGSFEPHIDQLKLEIVKRGMTSAIEIEWTATRRFLNVFVGAFLEKEPLVYQEIVDLISLATSEGLSISASLLDLAEK
jgi:hypothetical protein